MAKERKTQKQVACKVIDLRKKSAVKAMLIKEVKILMNLNHVRVCS